MGFGYTGVLDAVRRTDKECADLSPRDRRNNGRERNTMKSTIRSLTIMGVAALIASGCEFKNSHGTTAPTPVVNEVASTTSLVGTWVSQGSGGGGGVAAATATTQAVTLTGCSSFKWTVVNQTANVASGDFSIVCNGGIALSGNGLATLSGSNVAMAVNGTGTLPTGACAFSLNGSGTLVNNDTLRIPYSGTTCMGPVSGTETLVRSSVFPNPTPTPTPEPTPSPTPAPVPGPSPGGGLDAIDLHSATILNSPLDIANWPITTTITELNIRPSGIAVEFSKKDGPGRWPDVTPPGWDGPLQYTLGMCLNIGSRWYCSAVVEYWHGLAESGGPPWEYAMNWFYDPARWAPMTGHQPVPGEMIGFYVCGGDCRNNREGSLSPARERTNVVLVPMPGNGGAVYRF
jgi:hypothetical protein